MTTKTPHYTAKELELLKQYPNVGLGGVHALLEGRRSIRALRNKLTCMGLMPTLRTYNPINGWTDAECEVMRTQYAKGGYQACIEQLPGRTKNAIVSRAKLMGLQAPRTVAGLMPSQKRIQEEQEDDGLPVRRFLPAGAWRIDHHLPPASVFGLGAV